jgi:hypothetical protein
VDSSQAFSSNKRRKISEPVVRFSSFFFFLFFFPSTYIDVYNAWVCDCVRIEFD